MFSRKESWHLCSLQEGGVLGGFRWRKLVEALLLLSTALKVISEGCLSACRGLEGWEGSMIACYKSNLWDPNDLMSTTVHSFHLTQALESFLDHRCPNCGTAVCRAPSSFDLVKDFGFWYYMFDVIRKTHNDAGVHLPLVVIFNNGPEDEFNAGVGLCAVLQFISVSEYLHSACQFYVLIYDQHVRQQLSSLPEVWSAWISFRWTGFAAKRVVTRTEVRSNLFREDMWKSIKHDWTFQHR